MKAWITKYALSRGIIEVDDGEDFQGKGLLRVPSLNCVIHKDDWHTDEASAVAQAWRMRHLKILAVQRQLERLYGLRFHRDSIVKVETK